MALDSLHSGFDVPEYNGHIPWLITRSQLPGYVPGAMFDFSYDRWAKLRFTLLGIDAVHSFNFVTHPEGKLAMVQSDFSDCPDTEEIFRVNSIKLRERLGEPNSVNMPDSKHLRWDDARIWVDYAVSSPVHPMGSQSHSLEICYHAGIPSAWVPPSNKNLAAVVRMLNRLPGVEVTEVRRKPNQVTIGLTIFAAGSVSRLAQIAEATKLLMRVEVNHSRLRYDGLGRSNPAGALYCLDIPFPWEPLTENVTTDLQIFGIRLIGHLVEEKRMGKVEANRLENAFDDFEPVDPSAGS